MKTTIEKMEATAKRLDRWANEFAADPPTKWEAANSRLVKFYKKLSKKQRKAVARKKQQRKELKLKEDRENQKIQILIEGKAI